MSATDASKPSNVTATLRYLKWEKLYESQRPYQIYCPTEDTAIPKSNLSFEDGPEELIHDARHAEESFDLDRNGFTFVEYEYNPAWFTQPNLIEKYYLPVISRLVEKALGGKIVVQILEYQVIILCLLLLILVSLAILQRTKTYLDSPPRSEKTSLSRLRMALLT
jgi:hypothetical protein